MIEARVCETRRSSQQSLYRELSHRWRWEGVWRKDSVGSDCCSHGCGSCYADDGEMEVDVAAGNGEDQGGGTRLRIVKNEAWEALAPMQTAAYGLQIQDR